jgi:membrane fusion protein, multidrug efflux system
VGKELLKVVDPRSMRFEGLVSADRMGEIKLGQAVKFRINGVEGVEFAGKVQRLDASANAVTRQVEVLVAFDDAAKAPRVAGLYAEGRIETGVNAVPMLSETSIVRSGEAAHVWRVRKDGTLAKAAVQLGERDARSGEVVLKGGLADGDVILRKPGSTLVDGQKVEFVKAVASGVAK